MNRWPGVEYYARRVWERIPTTARRPLKRFLTRSVFRAQHPARTRHAPEEPGFSPPPVPSDQGRENPLRVLVEVPSLNPGGLEEFVLSLVTRMDRARFAPVVVCTESGGEIAERVRQAGIPLAVLQRSPKRQYERLLDQLPIDVVNAHYSDIGPPLAAARGVPVVTVIHNTYTWMGPADRRRLRREDRFVTQYVAVSRAVRDYAERVHGLPGAKIRCIDNGIDIRRHQKLLSAPMGLDRRDLNLSPDDFVFLHVAAVDAPKGHNVILAALAALVSDHPKTKVLSVGPVRDQIYCSRMQDRVRRWGLEGHFRFIGPTAAVHDFYRLSDAFLLPSLIEGFSLALLEAAFYGLPIIATRVGGAPDLLRGEPFGILIDPAYEDISNVGVAMLTRLATEEHPPHADQLIQAMREFLHRPDYWKAQGPSGREKVVASYDLAQTVNRYEDLFLEVASKRAGG